VAEMTGEARVVALDRLWPGDLADHSGDLLDVVFAGRVNLRLTT
jgi:hypothetical protein